MMKTLTLDEAKNLGFRPVRYGMNSYLPVVLPHEAQMQFLGDEALHNALLEQFDGVTTFDAGTTGDDRAGRFEQAIEYLNRVWVVTGYYSPENGVEQWDVFAAVKIS